MVATVSMIAAQEYWQKKTSLSERIDIIKSVPHVRGERDRKYYDRVYNKLIEIHGGQIAVWWKEEQATLEAIISGGKYVGADQQDNVSWWAA